MGTTTNHSSLARVLGLRSAISIVTGSVIGSGVFLVATEISVALPSPALAISVWVVAGVISFIGALIFAELGTLFPKAGGQFVYLTEAYHPMLGFLFGWTLVMVIQAGSIAAVAIAFAKFLSRLIPLEATQLNGVAGLTVVALTGINAFGIKKASYFLDAITLLKIVLIVFFAGTLWWLGGSQMPVESSSPLGTSNLSGYGVALIAAFWAFDGWNNIGFVAGEIFHPQRNIPLALGIGVGIITLLYVTTNMGYYRALPVSEIATSDFVAGDAMQRIGQSGWVTAVIALVALSSLGCLNNMILSGARVIYAMSKDGAIPSFFSITDKNTLSPNRALLFQMLWTMVLVYSGSYDQLFTYVVFAAFLFYGLSAVALLIFRKQGLSSEYKVPGRRILPLSYIAFVVCFSANALWEKPTESLCGLGIIILGIPLYWMFDRRK